MMCTDIGDRPIECGSSVSFVHLCENEAHRRIEAIYEAHPILRAWVPDPRLPACCQRDEIADASDWDAAWAWDELQFLRGER